MLVDVKKELDKKNTLLSHVILGCFADSIGKVAESDSYKKTGKVEVKIFLDGVEGDLQPLLDHWEEQVGDLITGEAKILLRDKYVDPWAEIAETIDDIRDRTKEVLEQKERELGWHG